MTVLSLILSYSDFISLPKPTPPHRGWVQLLLHSQHRVTPSPWIHGHLALVIAGIFDYVQCLWSFSFPVHFLYFPKGEVPHATLLHKTLQWFLIDSSPDTTQIFRHSPSCSDPYLSRLISWSLCLTFTIPPHPKYRATEPPTSPENTHVLQPPYFCTNHHVSPPLKTVLWVLSVLQELCLNLHDNDMK